MKDQNLIQEYIYQAYMQILSKKHYDKISVCEICTKAGVSRMSFYRSFSSKEDLTLKGFGKIILNIKNNIEKLDVCNEYTIIKEFFNGFINYKDLIHSIESSSISDIIALEISKKLQENTPNDYMKKTSKYIPIFYFSALGSVIITWLKEGAKESPDEMARLITSMVNSSIFNNKNSQIETNFEKLVNHDKFSSN
ncbi:MAG: TetR/AcrR family transcriptional regulator [Clostridia bacterium]|nr:TetR/AcrR family transcriptional regulator [Clostridia bacterium]